MYNVYFLRVRRRNKDTSTYLFYFTLYCLLDDRLSFLKHFAFFYLLTYKVIHNKAKNNKTKDIIKFLIPQKTNILQIKGIKHTKPQLVLYEHHPEKEKETLIGSH